MASWTDVINFVRTRYEVLEDRDGWLRFRLDAGEGRNQQVTAHHLADEWVEISSPVGRAAEIDLGRLLELAGEKSVGGAGVVDGVALLKHTVPLAALDVEQEFGRPVEALVERADAFENELTQGDEF